MEDKSDSNIFFSLRAISSFHRLYFICISNLDLIVNAFTLIINLSLLIFWTWVFRTYALLFFIFRILLSIRFFSKPFQKFFNLFYFFIFLILFIFLIFFLISYLTFLIIIIFIITSTKIEIHVKRRFFWRWLIKILGFLSSSCLKFFLFLTTHCLLFYWRDNQIC